MPKSIQDILDHAGELAERLEAYGPDDGVEAGARPDGSRGALSICG